jgi:hypothetical protein
MKTSQILEIIAFVLLIIFVFVQISNFYGFSSTNYGTYIAFYIFLLFTMLILPQTIE